MCTVLLPLGDNPIAVDKYIKSIQVNSSSIFLTLHLYVYISPSYEILPFISPQEFTTIQQKCICQKLSMRGGSAKIYSPKIFIRLEAFAATEFNKIFSGR